jgi:hypothetical protein
LIKKIKTYNNNNNNNDDEYNIIWIDIIYIYYILYSNRRNKKWV